jgi:hypothetical protein
VKLHKPSGSLNQFVATNKKTGITYPKVNGDRDPNNPDHWRWNFRGCLESLFKKLPKLYAVYEN